MHQYVGGLGPVFARALRGVGASAPLVVLEVAGSRLTVTLRPKLIARLMGVAPLIAEPDGRLAVTASRRKTWGWLMELRLSGERPYYFQTTKRDEVLSCLAEAGFEVPASDSRLRQQNHRAIDR